MALRAAANSSGGSGCWWGSSAGPSAHAAAAARNAAAARVANVARGADSPGHRTGDVIPHGSFRSFWRQVVIPKKYSTTYSQFAILPHPNPLPLGEGDLQESRPRGAPYLSKPRCRPLR